MCIRDSRESGEFPHEVGLFLSYPPEDVKGFIDHRANNFKCAGLWTVSYTHLFIAQDKRHEADTLFSQNFATLLIIGAVITALVLDRKSVV